MPKPEAFPLTPKVVGGIVVEPAVCCGVAVIAFPPISVDEVPLRTSRRRPPRAFPRPRQRHWAREPRRIHERRRVTRRLRAALLAERLDDVEPGERTARRAEIAVDVRGSDGELEFARDRTHGCDAERRVAVAAAASEREAGGRDDRDP